ncbi:MAG: phosphoenolpyruvate--protein phosphotransferase [Opitutales bacterium]
MDETRTETMIEGVAASPGVAHGPAFVILQSKLEIPVFQVDDARVPAEIERFEQALLESRKQLSQLRDEVAEQLGENEAHIFDAHIMVLEDKALIDSTIQEIRETGYNVEYCFREVANRFIDAFSEIPDAYLRERVKDLEDVTKRVLYCLLGEAQQTFSKLAAQHIIVTEDIPPSDAAALEGGKVLGVVTDAGSRTSHAVIVARSLGIPAVVGLHNATSLLENEDDILIDGYEGLVYVNPTPETLFRYGQLREERRGVQALFEKETAEPAETSDGYRILLGGNVSGEEECRAVLGNGGEAVGLFRTEAFYMRERAFPPEEDQFAVYRRIAEVMNPHPVVMRTLDMGGDKQFASIGFNIEERNPFMGFRAIRFCLEHEDIFRTQLRAILRASAFGNVQVMFPMISSVDEFLRAKDICHGCMEDLRYEGVPFDESIRIGTMVEVPSAAVVADQLAEHCDFFSIGTNDLIQYLLAVDRVNDRIAHLYRPFHPAVLRTIAGVITAASRHGIPTSICGEMAADPFYVPFFIGCGAAQLSVNASSLPEIKYLVRRVNLVEAKRLADRVLKISDASEIKSVLGTFFESCLKDFKTRVYYTSRQS